MSADAHFKALHGQHRKTQPDMSILKDYMKKTFTWSRQEIANGMAIEDILMKYPFLKTSSGVRALLEQYSC